MLTTETELVRLNEEEFLEASVAELRDNLKAHGIDVDDYPVSRIRQCDMRDYAIDTIYSEFVQYHTKC